MRDAARTARTINTMTDLEAEKAEIERREQGYYFRADVGKANLTPPAEYADWFKLVSVDLESFLTMDGLATITVTMSVS